MRTGHTDTRDREVRAGKERKHRVDLGLALLCLARKPGEIFPYDDIAAWAGCTHGAIQFLERQALRKVANLLKFGRGRLADEIDGAGSVAAPVPERAEVQRIVANATPRPLDKDEVKRAMARAWGKSRHGANAIPDYVVAAMAADYARLGSVRKVGRLYSRSGAAIAYIFRAHGVPLNGRGGANRGSADPVLARNGRAA